MIKLKIVSFFILLLAFMGCIKEVLPDTDYSGTWLGKGYQCPFGTFHNEKVTITQSGASIKAIKIDGDNCVTAGQITFQGKYDNKQKAFNVTWTTGEPNKPNSSSASGLLLLKGRDTLIDISLGGVVFIRQ
jgi:hypothetical protein